jgi:hypothetical protein
MINPHSVMSTAERKALSSGPGSSTLSISNPSSAASDHSREGSEDAEQRTAPKQLDPTKLTMLPSELRVIKRLSQRVNVLPIIGCADSLTDETLNAVKETIRSELAAAGLDFGVFGPPKFDQDPAQNGHSVVINLPKANAPPKTDDDTEDVEEEEEDRKSRGVIRLKTSRYSGVRRSRSRTRRDTTYSYTGDSEGVQNGVSPPEEDSVANVRFSASVFQKVDLSDILPFALVSPETMPERALSKPSRRPTMTSQVSASHDGSTYEYGEETPRGQSPDATSPVNGNGQAQSNLPYLDGPPADLRGVFVRKFRWGTIDVLNPDHCDFAALRTAVLSTHMMVRLPSSP